MPITKPLMPFDSPMIDEVDEIEIEVPEDTISTPTEDGGIVIQFGPEDEEETQEDVAHDDNLAEYIEESDLEGMAAELVDDFLNDRNSRKEWSMAYIKGLDLLGLKIEERSQPWQGASGVFHPMLTESVVRFQAQAMGELFPASGPARSKIMGKATTDRLKQAERVETELNYLLTEKMPDYRSELEQLLFRLPLAGSAFKKVYFDPIREVPVANFVPAEDLVASYGASSLETCPRFTHVMRKTKNEILELQAVGFYREVDIGLPTADKSDIQEKYDDLDGSDDTMFDDGRYTILEMYVDINMPKGFDDPNGIARPHVITIEKGSMTILSVRRNWREDDEKKRKRMHIIHYPYLPGLGFYGTGLIHLIGGLAKSATSIMRQLIDAGTLANLPAGLKSRGLRIKGDNTPLRPGEFRDVDVPGGAIRDAITFLPYKEPSGVLYQLLGNVVEEGRRIGSVADVQISDMNSQAPVGTTLALLERNMKVMSGVQARLHAAMKDELRLIAEIVHDHMDENYAYDMGGDFNRTEDFDGRVDVIPVSDPNASTMAQRIMQYQAALQLSTQAPQLYDMGKLHRQMLEVLGIQDAADIIKLPDDIKAKDPISENMAILKQEPVKAFDYQDHEAHIAVHQAAMQDPKIQQILGQSPFAQAIQAAAMAHINDHTALQYRKEIEKQLGVPLPPEGEFLPEDVEFELSRLTQLAAQKLLAKNQAEAAQQQAQQQAQDPVLQMQMKELELKEMKIKGDLQLEQQRLQMDAQNKSENIAVQRERIQSEDSREGARIGVRIAEKNEDADREDKKEGIRMGIDIANRLADRDAPQRGGE
jgi:hypothetical protein